jgi:hypothetical protein
MTKRPAKQPKVDALHATGAYADKVAAHKDLKKLLGKTAYDALVSRVTGFGVLDSAQAWLTLKLPAK